MAQRSEHFFTHEEAAVIKQTTLDAETRTSGEIVVMVVDRSDEYLDGEVIGAFVGGNLVSLIATEILFHGSLWYFIPIVFAVFFPLRLILRQIPALSLSFLGPTRRNRAVRHRAIRAFHEKGLTRTKGRTGVLFFISLLERKVWVLADKGIHEKIGQETLNKFAETVSSGIRTGRACDALCSAVREAGDLLERHFPRQHDDTDELPNDLLTG